MEQERGVRMRRSKAHLPFAVAIMLIASAQQAVGVTPANPGSSDATGAAQRDMQPGSEAGLRLQIFGQVAAAWKRSDFAWLDSTADEYIRTRVRTYSGKWRLAVFYCCALSEQLDIE